MAVYKKTYSGYSGPITPEWSRFFVLTRFTFEDMHRSRFLNIFFLTTFLWPLACALFIYFHHNLSGLKTLGVDPRQLMPIDSRFFLNYLGVQSMFAFFLNAFVGPGLVSPDVANNALPLYLARSFSRWEYVLGKFSVLFILMSVMTWAPGLLLFLLQGYLEGAGWMADNARIAGALFVGSLVWVVVLGLLALCVSAWVKWKPIAGALIFGVFFVAAGFGSVYNEVLRTKWGHLVNISHLMGSIWITLFERPLRRGEGALFFRVHESEQIPLWMCWLALVLICSACLALLMKRVRGAEVVR